MPCHQPKPLVICHVMLNVITIRRCLTIGRHTRHIWPCGTVWFRSVLIVHILIGWAVTQYRRQTMSCASAAARLATTATPPLRAPPTRVPCECRCPALPVLPSTSHPVERKKVKVKSSNCYSASYMKRTQDQKRFYNFTIGSGSCSWLT